MYLAKVHLESVAPICFSKYYDVPKLEREIPKDYEARTWRERVHSDRDGFVYIPAMMIKNTLASAAKFSSVQIPGKGKSTYTKHFEAGIMVTDPITLPVKKDEVDGFWLYVPSDGVRGGTKRVEKRFPIIEHWKGEAMVYILDEIITKDVFADHMRIAGQFIGFGAFRPRQNGDKGRFKVTGMEWAKA